MSGRKRNSRWAAVEWVVVAAILALASGTTGWFLPNGLGGAVHESFDHSPALKILSALVAFLIALVIELLIWMRKTLTEVTRRVDESLQRDLAAGVGLAAESAVIRALVASDAHEDDAALNALLFRRFGELIGMIPQGLLAGYSVLVESGLQQVRRTVRTLADEGTPVDIAQHVKITRRLAADSARFLQINRRAYQVPEEWTEPWKALVAELGASNLAAEYIVLMPLADLRQSSTKLRSMQRYLTRSGWALKTCELEAVHDTFGGRIPTTDNVDVFDERVAKLQALPRGHYTGGIDLHMRIVDLRHDEPLLQFIQTVKRYARPVLVD